MNEAIEQLLKFSLVRRDPNARTLTIHRLVQAALKEGMDKDTQCQWAERAVHAVSRAFPEVEFSTWLLCQQYLPHALMCRSLIERWNMEFPEATELLYNAGHYLWDRSQYAEAEPFLERTLAIREKLLGQENLEVAQTLNLLGIIYYSQAKFSQSEQLARQVLAIREKQLGREHLHLASSLDVLSIILYQQGKLIQSKAHTQRSLSITEKALGPKHHEVADKLWRLGEIFEAQHNYRKAESFYQQALAMDEKILGHEHPTVGSILTSLGELCYKEGKYSKAESCYQHALAIFEKVFGAEYPHPRLARIQHDYAVLLKKTKRTVEGTELEARAKTIEAIHTQENTANSGSRV